MQTIKSPIEVLLLEDSPQPLQLSTLLVSETSKYHLTTRVVPLSESEWDLLKAIRLDVALIHLSCIEIIKLELIPKLWETYPKLPLVFITANQEEITTIHERKFDISNDKIGIRDYLTQGDVSPFNLALTINSAIAKSQLSQNLKISQQNNLKLQAKLKEIQELFNTVVDSTSALIWMIDARENYTFLNQAWLSFIGKTLEEGLEEKWRERIHPEDLKRCDQAYQSALKKCQGFQIEYRIKRFDNNYRTILNTAVRRDNSQGEFAGILCSCLDITQRKIMERKLLHKAETDHILAEITQNLHSSLELNIILETSIEQINRYLQTDQIFIIKVLNNSQLKLLFETGKNKSLTCDINLKHKLLSQEIIANYKLLAQGKIVTQDSLSISEILNIDNTNLANLDLPFLLVPIISHQQLWGILGVKQDARLRQWELDEIRLLERVAIQLGIAIKQSELFQELEELSVIDGLTKIANRRKLDRYLAQEWKRLTREQNPLSLILCDVDHFKLYNDTYGHQAGDRCLRQVAQAITSVVKRPADLVARYGGEEFAVILPNTHIQGAEYIAQKIRLQIASLHIPHINSPVDLYVTLSFGIASCIPCPDMGSYTLVAGADRGLYQAKESGRDCIVKFEIDNL